MRSNPSGNWIGSHLRLAVVVAVLAVTSLLPAGWLGWVSSLAAPVQAIIAPWQSQLTRMAHWARARTGGSALSPADRAVVEDLLRQRDAAQFSLVQANAQIEELRKRISEISRGMELNNLPVAPVAAQVIGGAADLSIKALTVKAGRRQGVEINNVAVVGGVHVVGLVKRVTDRTCNVLPITDRAADLVTGRIMIDDTTPGPMCPLEPDGKGHLTGLVEDDPRFRDPSGRTLPINPETIVRLYDRSWPLSAQGLILGRVIKSEPLPEQPLRQTVTVAPIESIERLTELTIRTVHGDESPAGTTPGPEGTP
jgi:hypothetical protein